MIPAIIMGPPMIIIRGPKKEGSTLAMRRKKPKKIKVAPNAIPKAVPNAIIQSSFLTLYRSLFSSSFQFFFFEPEL